MVEKDYKKGIRAYYFTKETDPIIKVFNNPNAVQVLLLLATNKNTTDDLKANLPINRFNTFNQLYRDEFERIEIIHKTTIKISNKKEKKYGWRRGYIFDWDILIKHILNLILQDTNETIKRLSNIDYKKRTIEVFQFRLKNFIENPNKNNKNWLISQLYYYFDDVLKSNWFKEKMELMEKERIDNIRKKGIELPTMNYLIRNFLLALGSDLSNGAIFRLNKTLKGVPYTKEKIDERDFENFCQFYYQFILSVPEWEIVLKPDLEQKESQEHAEMLDPIKFKPLNELTIGDFNQDIKFHQDKIKSSKLKILQTKQLLKKLQERGDLNRLSNSTNRRSVKNS